MKRVREEFEKVVRDSDDWLEADAGMSKKDFLAKHVKLEAIMD